MSQNNQDGFEFLFGYSVFVSFAIILTCIAILIEKRKEAIKSKALMPL